MTLTEALAALDAVTCGLPMCRFRAVANDANPLSDTGCLCLHPYRLQATRNAALAAVVKAAREEVRKAEQRYYDDRAKEARAFLEKERRGR